ncbi:small multi-drug export protein [Patescibacteria group bacterium]|nr:small multi-drug export protein [Patescibacteria group bacterium]
MINLEGLENLSPILATFFLAMVPFTEFRASIPVGIGFYNLPAWLAFLASVSGDLIPAVLIVLFLKPFSEFLSERSAFFKKIFDWWFKRVMKDFEKKYVKYGALALMIFVAIPLPVTGSWAGAVASFIFKIPKKTAILFISIGVLVSAVIVTIISSGIFNSLK